MYGHLDSTITFEDLPLLNQLNVIADTLAKTALEDAFASKRYISSDWPLERARVYKNGTKLTSSIKSQLVEIWGREVARDLFLARGITDKKGFEMIHFQSMGRAMARFPQGFRVWVCKEVSHFAGTNRLLSAYDKSVENKCPSCGEPNESTSHLTRCLDPGRTAMFTESVLALVYWLEDTHMDEHLILGFLDYLQARGRVPLSRLLRQYPEYQLYARDHDHLGWQNFMEGRIASTLLPLQEASLRQCESMQTAESWSAQFIQHLLSITHRQWLYRNARIYTQVKEGRTVPQHVEVLEEVGDMLQVDPSNLLPRHRYLLEQDWRALGEGSTSSRLQWLEAMDAAILAKRSLLTTAWPGPSTRPNTTGLDIRSRSNLAKRICSHRQAVSPQSHIVGTEGPTAPS